MQPQLDTFRDFYNTIRPHRGIGRKTPEFAYGLIPNAAPAIPEQTNIWQVRFDIVDSSGSIALRYAGKLRHLGVGRARARTEVICLVHHDHATVITYDGEVLGEYVIDPKKNHQAKTAEPPH